MFFDNGLFHFKHIVILAVCAIAITLFTIYAIKKIKIEQFHRILLIVGVISETLKCFTYICVNEDTLGGYLPKTDLPFHLCSIQLILILILNLSKNENLKHLLHGFMVPTCMIGGFFALLLATDSSRNLWVITIQYFLYHSTIIAFAIYLLANKAIKFTIKDYRNTIFLLFGIFLCAIYLNSWVSYKLDDGTFANINFMYVVNPPVDGLPFLNKSHGWLVYIIHYVSLSLTCITLTYIKPIIEFFKSKKEANVEKVENN